MRLFRQRVERSAEGDPPIKRHAYGHIMKRVVEIRLASRAGSAARLETDSGRLVGAVVYEYLQVTAPHLDEVLIVVKTTQGEKYVDPRTPIRNIEPSGEPLQIILIPMYEGT